MYSDLFCAHLTAAILHGLLTLAAIVSAFEQVQTVAVFDTWPQWNFTKCRESFGDSSIGICPQTCPFRDEEASRVLGDVNMTAVLILSQFVTCAAHCVQAYWLYVQQPVYVMLNERGLKVAFWVEYVITASTLAYVVIYYSGVIDFRSQMVAVVSQSTLMLLGLLLDLLRHTATVLKEDFKLSASRTVRWICLPVFVVGFANVSTVWFPSLYKLSDGDTGAPAWVFWIVLSEFLLYTSFGIVQLGFFLPFLLRGEAVTQRLMFWENVAFISLSFISKAILNTVFSVCLVYGLCQNE